RLTSLLLSLHVLLPLILVFFFLLLRRLPPSPLFPYTTLFRSPDARGDRPGAGVRLPDLRRSRLPDPVGVHGAHAARVRRLYRRPDIRRKDQLSDRRAGEGRRRGDRGSGLLERGLPVHPFGQSGTPDAAEHRWGHRGPAPRPERPGQAGDRRRWSDGGRLLPGGGPPGRRRAARRAVPQRAAGPL